MSIKDIPYLVKRLGAGFVVMGLITWPLLAHAQSYQGYQGADGQGFLMPGGQSTYQSGASTMSSGYLHEDAHGYYRPLQLSEQNQAYNSQGFLVPGGSQTSTSQHLQAQYNTAVLPYVGGTYQGSVGGAQQLGTLQPVSGLAVPSRPFSGIGTAASNFQARVEQEYHTAVAPYLTNGGASGNGSSTQYVSAPAGTSPFSNFQARVEQEYAEAVMPYLSQSQVQQYYPQFAGQTHPPATAPGSAADGQTYPSYAEREYATAMAPYFPERYQPIVDAPLPSPRPTPTALPNSTRCSWWEFWCEEAVAAGPTYIALGDSIAAGLLANQGYVPRYHALLEAHTDQHIQLVNVGRIGWDSERLLLALKTDDAARQDIRAAQYVTFNIGGKDLLDARELYKEGRCGGSDNQDCLRRTVQKLAENWTEIVAEIAELRSHEQISSTKTMDVYNPFVAEDMAQDTWPDDAGGDFIVFQPYLTEVNQHVTATATAQGIAVAHVMRAFNGADGMIDPAMQGYMSVDGFHPNDSGHQVIAQALIQ